MVVVYVLVHFQTTRSPVGTNMPRLSTLHFFCRNGTSASDAYSIRTVPSSFLSAKNRRMPFIFSYIGPV